jgi:carbon dioxide concentrating mechanism protein CcmN
VLIVGSGTVGENACVSAGSTLINPQVSAQDVVPPNAIINGSAIGSAIGNAAPSANGRAAINGFVSVASPSGTLSGTSNGTSNNGVQLGHGTLDGAGQAASGSSSLSLSSYDRVYGREQVSQLISALFPGRQSLNGNGNGNGHTDSAPPR